MSDERVLENALMKAMQHKVVRAYFIMCILLNILGALIITTQSVVTVFACSLIYAIVTLYFMSSVKDTKFVFINLLGAISIFAVYLSFSATMSKIPWTIIGDTCFGLAMANLFFAFLEYVIIKERRVRALTSGQYI